MRERGALWFLSSGAKKKRDTHKSPAVDYNEYLQLQATSTFDSIGLGQFKMIRKDVASGRCDASSFGSEWSHLLKTAQIEKFGEEEFTVEARNEITRVLQAYVSLPNILHAPLLFCYHRVGMSSATPIQDMCRA